MFFIVLACVIILDQSTKYLAYIYLQPQNTIPVINKFFYLTYLENTGAAFGILRGRVWLLAVITVCLILFAGYYVYRNRRMPRSAKVGITLITAGALGNLIDRIRLGYVIDFFDLRFLPIFNVADISVVLGAAILIIVLLFRKQKNVY